MKDLGIMESIYANYNENNIFVIIIALIQVVVDIQNVVENVVKNIFLMDNLIKGYANVLNGKETLIVIPVEKSVLLEINQMDVMKDVYWNMDMM
jgi:hypothetical protein